MRASAGAASQPARTLGSNLTSMFGREAELDAVLALLDDPARRLVTLTGPAGVGKTRLAQQIVATLIEEFGREVVSVPLASIRNPQLVLQTIGQALDPAIDTGDGFEVRLATTLRQRSRPILVLDNFEQLLDAASHVAGLLEHCPEATFVVTSQAALEVPGEQLYQLPPLPTPAIDETTAESILRSDAVALFIARAQAVNPRLVIDDPAAMTIAEICRRLDGLPLAIELAAARVNILSPQALLARLSNRLQVLGGVRRGMPDRLRTMRHAVAWSYDLLAPSEQDLFRAVSVFSAGFPLDAVEAISKETEGERDPWRAISALVNHSLVQAGSSPGQDARFLMLETLRAFGLERLAQRGEEQSTRRAHAMWIRQLASEAELGLRGGDQEHWLNRLEPEWENLRSAMGWSLDNGHADIVLATLSAIRRFITAHGHVGEARGFLDRALDATAGERSVARCHGLIAAGNLAEDQGDMDIAHAYGSQAHALAVELGDQRCEAQALIALGYVAHDRGDYPVALELHARAGELARSLGDRHILGTALGNLAAVSYFQGNLDDARRYWEEAGRIFASLEDRLTEALVLGNLGAIAAEQGEYQRAEALQQRALTLQRQLGNAPNIALALINLADVSYRLGDHTLANDQLAEAIPMLRDLGFKAAEGIALHTLAAVALAEEEPERSATAILESMRLLAEADDQLNICGNVDLLANLCARRHNHELAIELIGAAATHRRRLGSVLNPVSAAEVEALDWSLRENVAGPVYQRQAQAGAALDFETLVRRAGTIAREIAGPQRPLPALASASDSLVEHGLTRRELDVLRLLAEGRSTKEIADTLFISPRTATTHINNIFGKLDVNSRTAAVALAMRAGLV